MGGGGCASTPGVLCVFQFDGAGVLLFRGDAEG